MQRVLTVLVVILLFLGTSARGADVHWQIVNAGTAEVDAAGAPPAMPLETLAKAEHKPLAAKAARAVVEGETLPLAHRAMLCYFDALRAGK